MRQRTALCRGLRRPRGPRAGGGGETPTSGATEEGTTVDASDDDEVEEAWRIVDSIVAGWQQSGDRPLPYGAGTWGPAQADRLLARGRKWRKP